MDTNGQLAEREAADRASASTAARPGTSLEEGLGFRLGRAHRAVRFAWEARIEDLRLSGAQASVLWAVAEQPGTSLRELARRLRTDPMNAKRLADGLEEAGLLASVGDPADRRRRVLGPTDAGLSVTREIQRRALEWRATLEVIIGPDDAARLSLMLTRIEDGIAGLLDCQATEGGDGRG